MFVKILMICMLLFSCTAYAFDEVYHKIGESGYVSTLSFKKSGDRVIYAELKVPFERQTVYFIGRVFPTEKDFMFTAEYVGHTENGVLIDKQFPFYLDVENNEMVTADCKFKFVDDNVKITSFMPENYRKMFELPDLNGLYRLSSDKFTLSQPMTAYVIQKTDPYLVKYFLTRKDVDTWWFDVLEDGYDAQLGYHPRCIWAEPVDQDGETIGSYLLADDLSLMYKNNEIMFEDYNRPFKENVFN